MNTDLYTIYGPFNEFVGCEWASSADEAIERALGAGQNDQGHYSAHVSECVSPDSLEY